MANVIEATVLMQVALANSMFLQLVTVTNTIKMGVVFSGYIIWGVDIWITNVRLSDFL